MQFDSRLLVIDTESTGTDPATDRIVELAAVYFEGRAYVSHRQMLVDPEVPIPREASEIHHITDAKVAGKPKFHEIAGAFLRHVDGEPDGTEPPLLVGYNALAFDVPLLDAELARAGIDRRLDASRVLDPMVFVRYHLRHLRQRNLSAVCSHYGVKLENAHRAQADARATGKLLLRMVDAGVIPDDVDAALARQAEYRRTVDDEWTEFMYWLYRDRDDGRLRIGAGKHCGTPLAEVDGGYLDYLLAKVDDLPTGVRNAIRDERAIG